MTKEDKLKKIIEIAVERGWRTEMLWDDYYDEPAVARNGKYEPVGLGYFIFSHDFLKAYFGEVDLVIDPGFLATSEELLKARIKSWQLHAQELALSEDRIEYLWENRPER